MTHAPALWATPRHHLRLFSPDHPVLYVSPAILQATAHRFLTGFPGLVTYAVKANDADMVLENLMAAGLEAFDVASPDEMRKVRRLMPGARLHYNNPVRAPSEIAVAVELGVQSYSVDQMAELEKLIERGVMPGTEIAVRLKLPVAGAAYDFGAKFGASPETARLLLARVAEEGFVPAITFHPGTQCPTVEAWVSYIHASARVAREAGVQIARLNVGGGFPANRGGDAPDLEVIFEGIAAAVDDAFGDMTPALVCEPGRAMVAEAFSLATRVKAMRDDGSVVLNDGIYGGFAEFTSMGSIQRFDVLGAGAIPKTGALRDAVIWGPTCDSLDRLPGVLRLPETLADGDFLIFHGMGAYSAATATRFNGYGAIEVITVGALH